MPEEVSSNHPADELEQAIENDVRGIDPEIIDETVEGNNSGPIKYKISSYGTDLEVELLVQRLQKGTYAIPDYQRGYVWTQSRASRFIESLLLGLPVPGIFLYRDGTTKTFLVLDGHQRLKTLQSFYEGRFPNTEKVFTLKEVDNRFEGRTYAELEGEDKTALDTSVIHATVIEQESPNEPEKSSVYHIFRRINSGAVPLSPHEVRYCVSFGTLAKEIKKWNQDDNWRELIGPTSVRMKDQELVLRIFALFFASDKYIEPMQDFLDGFLDAHQNVVEIDGIGLEDLFRETARVVNNWLGKRAFRFGKQVNAAFADALMVATARGLHNGSLLDEADFVAGYEKLREDEDFIVAVEKATARKDNVDTRLKRAMALLTR